MRLIGAIITALLALIVIEGIAYVTVLDTKKPECPPPYFDHCERAKLYEACGDYEASGGWASQVQAAKSYYDAAQYEHSLCNENNTG